MVHEALSIGCTFENLSMIALVDFKTCSSVDKSLGRLLTGMRLTNIFVNLLHEFFNIVAGSRNARKNYLYFGREDALLIRQIKTGAIFEQVYKFSFMFSYENLENIAVPVSTIEFNFYKLMTARTRFDCLLSVPT